MFRNFALKLSENSQRGRNLFPADLQQMSIRALFATSGAPHRRQRIECETFRKTSKAAISEVRQKKRFVLSRNYSSKRCICFLSLLR